MIATTVRSHGLEMQAYKALGRPAFVDEVLPEYCPAFILRPESLGSTMSLTFDYPRILPLHVDLLARDMHILSRTRLAVRRYFFNPSPAG